MSGTNWGHALMSQHAIVAAARHHEQCTVCGCPPDAPCDCAPGVHLCRVYLAAHDGHLTYADAASVTGNRVFAGYSVVPDPEVTA